MTESCKSEIELRGMLHRQIWAMAEYVRGSISSWEFKQYVLDILFYRFISEKFAAYMDGGAASGGYALASDADIAPEHVAAAIKANGYFIQPSQLFQNVLIEARETANRDLNVKLKRVFDAIENSANCYPSESKIKGLFTDFDATSSNLGASVNEKNKCLSEVLTGIANLDFVVEADGRKADLFGDAYSFLISMYASNAGKSGGEFFTPPNVSKLIARIAMSGLDRINGIYDPACGSGSLLLQAKNQIGEKNIERGFFGQEINPTTYNLARMNMFMHGVNYAMFDIRLGDTLLNPCFRDAKPFDVVVSNPPYSIKWKGADDPTLINDPCYAPASVLAPKSKADLAFILRALGYLSSRGRAAIVCFPGVLYRGGAEAKIREYLVKENFIEAVIALPPNLFYGTTIAVCILVLSKHKLDDAIRFIDASGLYKKEVNNNVLLPEHIDEIMRAFASRKNLRHFARSAGIREVEKNDWKLSVSFYVEAKDTRPKVDIAKVNAELEQIAARENELRSQINAVIAEIEGEN